MSNKYDVKMELIEFKISRYGSTLITGILLSESNQWVAIKDNTVDYVLDGVRFTNKKYIINQHVVHNEIKSVVFPLRYMEYKSDREFVDELNLNDVLLFFQDLKEKGILLEVGMHDEGIIYVGTVCAVFTKSLILSTIDIDAKNSGPMHITFDKVRYVKIGSDYLDALCLYTKSRGQFDSSVNHRDRY